MKSPRTLTALLLCALVAGCSASSVGTQPAELGTPATLADMTALIEEPGPIVFEKHLSAHWTVPLSGLLNLDHPKAVAAGLREWQFNAGGVIDIFGDGSVWAIHTPGHQALE